MLKIDKQKVFETNLLDDSSGPDQTMPEVNDFFNVFKRKIKFNVIRDSNLITFLQGESMLTYRLNVCSLECVFFAEFYPTFEFQSGFDHSLCHFDHIYVYSLLLHFSCVSQMDTYFQNACLKISPAHQKVIHQFLNVLTERTEFDKESLSVIMNEASMVSHVPPLKILPSIQTGIMSPSTPKSTMLNSKMVTIRNLEAKLLSEIQRAEDNELEFQDKLRQKRK